MILTTLTLLYFFEAFGLFAIGSLAFMRQRARSHLAFFFFAVSTGTWQLLQALAIATSGNTPLSSTLFVSSIGFTAIMTAALYYFASVYTGRKFNYALWSITAVVAVLPLFSEDLRQVPISPDGIGVPKLDPYYGAVLFFDVGMLLLSIGTLIHFYAQSTSTKERSRTSILLAVTGIAGAIIVWSSVYTSDFSGTLLAQQIVPLTNLFAVLGFLYAVVYRDLFDIHVFVLRLAAYVSTYFIVAVLVVIPIVYFAGNMFGIELTTSRVLLASFLVVVVLYAMQLLRAQLDRVTARIFFRRIYDPQSLIDEHNSMLVAQSDVDGLLQGSAGVLNKYIQPELVVYWLKKRPNNPEHYITTGKDMPSNDKFLSEIRHKLDSQTQQAIIADHLGAGDAELKEYLISIGVAVVVKLLVPKDRHHTELGLLLLGVKKSGDTYGSRDVQVLQVVTNELVIAIQNAMRFEEIRNFNATLQEKVNVATAQLKQNNKKLHELDKSKDEFISMASHQLRTPLTAVKGYISMVLDGDIGSITKEQRAVLDQAFESSQRMVYLIGDFLNVSRIQTGKFMLERSDINVADLIPEEIDQLIDTAHRRNIDIKYTKPDNLPKISADENKLRQVMMNFMDNAIYYSHPGTSIVVQLYKDAEDIVFKVIDSGIGVPKTEQPRLFTKFYRATNARQQRPDGTGIGLYMAKKVIVDHGGSVIFETKEGLGSTFGFRLPLKNQLQQLDK